MIKIDTSEWKKYGTLLKSLEKKVPSGISKMLNDMAFGTRNTAIEGIENTMTIRAKQFVYSRIQVTKATVASQQSIVGSVATKNFSGFGEQEEGGISKILKKRLIRKEARGGDMKRKVIRSNRLSPYNQLELATSLGMIRSFSRKGYRKPFIINYPGEDTIEPGLYKLVGRRDKQKLVQLQSFVHPTKAKGDPWMKPAPAKFFARWNINKAWFINWGRYIKK
jgi:hypothetical protein